MTKKGKILLAVLLVAVVAATVTVTSASGPAPEPYVDSWEVVQAMSEEEVIAIGKVILTCEYGELPDHAFAAVVRLQEIDPELAQACFIHIDKTAVPAVAPEEKRDSSRSKGPEPFGAYVRNGNGGYYEFD